MNKTTLKDAAVFNRRITRDYRTSIFSLTSLFFLASPLVAQSENDEKDEIYTLSPFEITADDTSGYRATSSLAGSRLATDLKDIGSAITVFTEELMEDIGAVDNESLLAFGVNTEVGGANGNFIGANNQGGENSNVDKPNKNTRVRGLTSADNTRNYFKTDVPWDSYNTSRVDLQRGANSILFGLGSPAGIVNATSDQASFENEGEVSLKYDQFGSIRLSTMLNKVFIEDELAARVNVLRDDQKFRQKPGFDDDKRAYFAFTYQPKGLNSDSQTFKIRTNYENGSISSNRPRYIAPIDNVSAWYTPEGETGFAGEFRYLTDEYGDNGLGGRLVNQFTEGEITTVGGPIFNPTVGQTFNGINPSIYFEHGSDTPIFREKSVNSRGGYLVGEDDGEVSLNIPSYGVAVSSNVQNTRGLLVWGTQRRAAEAGLPYQGFWRDQSISDTSLFDPFYNLIDGNTKSESKDWSVLELNLTNTFFNNQLGYTIAYFKQDYDRDQTVVMGLPKLNVNIGAYDTMATPENPIENPYAGQVYISNPVNQGNNFASNRKRESKLAQAFASWDFADKSDGLFSRILGKHDFTGIVKSRSYEETGRRYTPWGVGRDWLLERSSRYNADVAVDAGLTEYGGTRTGDLNIYITGPEGISSSEPSNLPNLVVPEGTVPFTYFDATWNAGDSVDPAADWLNPYTGGVQTQSRNPDNYVGWTTGSYSFYNARASSESLDYLTTSYFVKNEEIDSRALTWQGRFFNGGVVGMYGWRRDEAMALQNGRYAIANPDPDELDEDLIGGRVYDSLDVQTRNWSAKINLFRILGMEDSMPVQFHLLYNEGEVTAPVANRYDAFGRQLGPSVGETEDASAIIEGSGGKWSLRVTNYKTVNSNVSSTASVDSELWRLEQAFENGSKAAARIESHPVNTDYTADWLNGLVSVPDEYGSLLEWRQASAAGYRLMEAELWENFPEARVWFNDSYTPGGLVEPSVDFPLGSTMVEDQTSKGWEFEATVKPNKNWNIAFNASKTEAVRDGTAEDEFGQIIDLVLEHMDGPAGDLPYYWGAGPRSEDMVAPLAGEIIKARALNGTAQPEIREWKANLMNNYYFSEGRLKGLNIGGAFRFEDSSAYGYRLYTDEESGLEYLDVNTTFEDDERVTVYLWAGYNMKLNDNLDWKIQLNLNNVGGSNEFVPLSINPDGTIGLQGIREGSSWALTNTFSF